MLYLSQDKKNPCRLYVFMCLTFVDPWQCIYGRPGGHLFTKNAFAAVLHHQNSPEFYDEVRRTAKSHTRVILSVRVCDVWHFLSHSSRSSCRRSSTRSTTSCSPCTTSAATATARPAPRRETWWRLKVVRRALVPLYYVWERRLTGVLSQWASPGCRC